MDATNPAASQDLFHCFEQTSHEKALNPGVNSQSMVLQKYIYIYWYKYKFDASLLLCRKMWACILSLLPFSKKGR